jgi:hypothetical protein
MGLRPWLRQLPEKHQAALLEVEELDTEAERMLQPGLDEASSTLEDLYTEAQRVELMLPGLAQEIAERVGIFAAVSVRALGAPAVGHRVRGVS